MPTTPDQVVNALQDALNITAAVRLEHVDGTPYAVIVRPSGVATWVDLRASIAASPDRDADYVTASIMTFERWRALDLDELLSELCSKLGFCDAAYQKRGLTSRGPYTVDAFTDAVIEAEGLDPMTTDSRRAIREIVARHFGL